MTIMLVNRDVIHERGGRLESLLVCCVLSLLIADVAWGLAASEGPARVQMTVHGPVLAAPDGRTLYWWSRDERTPGQSQCDNTRHTSYRHVTGQTVYLPHSETRKTCEEKWPPFRAADDARPHGKWSVITRHDDSRQWAFSGHPLHLSTKDQQAGEVNGVNGVKERNYGGWRPAMAPLEMPPGVELLQLREGLVLMTEDRHVLYAQDPDRSPCTDCTSRPTPLVAGALVTRVGEWSVVGSSGGLRQYAFRDAPVYVAPDSVTGPYPEQIDGWLPIFFERAVPTPSAIETRFSLIGDIYTNRDGMALYVFTCGEGPHSVPCDDPEDAAAHWSIVCGAPEFCARRWRPYRATPGAEDSGEWSIKTIPHPVFVDSTGFTYAEDSGSPMVRVWAYRGRPVYTFADDDEPAQVLGHEMTGLPGSGFFAIQAPGNRDTTLSR